uniref:Uncharacterized protein n=1 Tax=Rhizophora mucronata TaxID=61149 RepID=A0A2P2KKJ0_RHIMU
MLISKLHFTCSEQPNTKGKIDSKEQNKNKSTITRKPAIFVATD